MSEEEKEHILGILNELFEQCDEDCPVEARSRHLIRALKDAEELLIENGLRWNVKLKE